MERKDQPISLCVVDISDPCECHRLILTREFSQHVWRYFLIRKPTWVELFDLLEYYPDSAEIFHIRNPKLRFRVSFDIFTDDIDVDKLIDDLPYKEIHGDGAIFKDESEQN